MPTRNRRTPAAMLPKARKKVTPRKKSRQSNGSVSGLSVRTPQDSTLQVLAEVGLVVPDEIPLDDDLLLLDFTLLGNRDIGSIHSRYAVRHAHAIFQAAKAAARVATLKRGLRVSEAKFRISRKGQQLNVVQALMEDDEHITKQRDKVSKAEIEHDLITAVAQGYEDIRNAASREISRRLGERAATD
jgi:hypothetical protein